MSAAFTLAIARAELAVTRRRLLIALFAALTFVFDLAGLHVSRWVYAVFALWMGIAIVSGSVLARARGPRDADRVQAIAYLIDAVLLTVACALFEGGWGLGITVYAFGVTFAFATLPRSRARLVAAIALLGFLLLVLGEATGVIAHEGSTGFPPLFRNWGMALAAALYGTSMILTFAAVQVTFVRVMRRAQERYRLLLQTAPDMILSTDRDGVIASANEAARLFALGSAMAARASDPSRRTSAPGTSLVGTHAALLAHPDEREQLASDLATAAIGEARQRELRLVGGAEGWYLVSCNPIREDERVTGVLVVARDITARKQDEEALRRSEEKLRQAQKMEAVGRLAGGVAHDFNNLLTVIGTYSELLLQGIADGTPRRADVEEIYKATVRASTLTNQLLTFSRKQVVQPKLINLNDVVLGIETMLRRLIDVGIAIETHTFGGLSETRADPAQLEQVVLNLAVNARDAMPDGGLLRVETDEAFLDAEYAAAHAGVKPGRYVLLSVSDTGLGMDEQTRARIFEPFFTTKRDGQGTGLGLATVYGIVQQCGGHIDVESDVGSGTNFRIYLPVAHAEAAATKVVAPATNGRGAHGVAPVDGRGTTTARATAAATTEPSVERITPRSAAAIAEGPVPRATADETILLVEDGEALRDVLLRVLEEFGYRVLVARDGDEALAVSDRHDGAIHLLVTDVVMPHMGGRELAVELWGRRPETRVLFMSGYTEDSILQQGLRKPTVGFIGKPFRPEALARKVREMLDRALVGSGE